MLKKSSLKLLCVLLLITLSFIPTQIKANSMLSEYTYEDYLEDKRWDEVEAEEEKEKEQEKTTQGFMVFASLVLLIFVLYVWNKSNKKAELERKNQEEKERIQEAQRRKKVQEEIEKRYPEFDAEGLKKFVQYILDHLQKAVEDKDFDKLKAMETEELYTSHSVLVENLGTNKQCARHQNVLSIVTQSFLTGAHDRISLDVYLELVEYYYDQIQMKIIRGNDHTVRSRVYNIELVHKTSLQEITYLTCPNCGAPIDLTEQGQCAYCHSLLQKKVSSWLVNKYEIV